MITQADDRCMIVVLPLHHGEQESPDRVITPIFRSPKSS
jgi:hypothetical protein